MQKKDTYNLNNKSVFILSCLLTCLIFASSCGKKADPLRPNEQKVEK
tara:strand:- start:1739 stop:1879 length:141 start_codon:yes stop_codon:yes gene_type:complete